MFCFSWMFTLSTFSWARDMLCLCCCADLQLCDYKLEKQFRATPTIYPLLRKHENQAPFSLFVRFHVMVLFNCEKDGQVWQKYPALSVCSGTDTSREMGGLVTFFNCHWDREVQFKAGCAQFFLGKGLGWPI